MHWKLEPQIKGAKTRKGVREKVGDILEMVKRNGKEFGGFTVVGIMSIDW